jgi:DNA-binding MarR family transcriptional regulator
VTPADPASALPATGAARTGAGTDGVEIVPGVPEGGPLVLFTYLARTALYLEALQDECLAGSGISFGDYSVLRVLRNIGAPHRMAPSRLAEVVLRTTGGMTKIVDRLERAGLVERERDPADRRGVLVRLTRRGMTVSDRASAAYTVGRERILARLDPAEVDELDAAMRRLLEVFRDDRAHGDGHDGREAR